MKYSILVMLVITVVYTKQAISEVKMPGNRYMAPDQVPVVTRNKVGTAPLPHLELRESICFPPSCI